MAEVIVTFLELLVRNPNRNTIAFVPHSSVDIISQSIAETVRVGSQCANPEHIAQDLRHGVQRVLQATVTVHVGFEPVWRWRRYFTCACAVRDTSRGPRRLASETGLLPIRTMMRRLMSSRNFHRRRKRSRSGHDLGSLSQGSEVEWVVGGFASRCHNGWRCETALILEIVDNTPQRSL
jgi:hypothetical protein